jgi:hypothetical protein
MRLLQESSPNIKVGGVQYGNPINHPQAALQRRGCFAACRS